MSVMTRSRLKVTRHSGALGAYISGVDLSQDDSQETTDAIRTVMDEHSVVFLEGQEKLTKAQFVAFGKRLGELWVGNGHPPDPQLPELQQLIKEADSKMGTGEVWHADQTFVANPHRWTMLHAIEIPPHGGDTVFVGAGAAFESLSEGMKETLRGLNGFHWRPQISRLTKNYDSNRFNDTSKLVDEFHVHPLVLVHPVTGREFLYANPGYTHRIDGWTEAESKPLLQFLADHTTSLEYQCRFKWKKGALALWDNRQLWHYGVNDYHGHRRELSRLMIK